MATKAEILADLWTAKWLHSMRTRGKNVTEIGLINYRKAAKDKAIMILQAHKR